MEFRTFFFLENSEKKLCRFRDDDDCMFYFTYEYNSNRVEAQLTKGRCQTDRQTDRQQ